MMVSTYTCEANDLFKFAEVISEFLGAECWAIVGQEFLRDDAEIGAHLFEGFLSSEGGMGRQCRLMFNMNVA